MKVALSTAAAELEDALDAEAAPGLPAGIDLMARLEGICAGRGLAALAGRLADLAAFVCGNLEVFEEEFNRLPRSARLVGKSAAHLLDLGGKRLRPTCVALAARVGSGFGRETLDLAVAVELVHGATLLHDDVVDLGDTRRGAPSARAVYGNAASIFAGDWLLIEALRRVERCRLPGVLTDLFETIEQMIFAESLQLEWRGSLATDSDLYFRVAEGKTASLFRWAMRSGGVAGGVSEEDREALAGYGSHLGVAFQAVDDLLDLTGDAERTGKEIFTDLREGKMTYPLILALEREPTLRPAIEDVLRSGGSETFHEGGVHPQTAARIVDALRETGAVADCLELARQRSAAAVASLERLPESRARRALATIAEAIVDRDL